MRGDPLMLTILWHISMAIARAIVIIIIMKL